MRKYIILNVDQLPYVNFSEFLQKEDTIIYLTSNTLSGTYTVLKWEGDDPSCLDNFGYDGPYDENEVLIVLENSFIEITGEDDQYDGGDI